MYRVFDDKFANTTTVIIQVLDVNDNAPRFDNAIYNVTDVQEEEPGISKNNHKYLLTVISHLFFLYFRCTICHYYLHVSSASLASSFFENIFPPIHPSISHCVPTFLHHLFIYWSFTHHQRAAPLQLCNFSNGLIASASVQLVESRAQSPR